MSTTRAKKHTISVEPYGYFEDSMEIPFFIRTDLSANEEEIVSEFKINLDKLLSDDLLLVRQYESVSSEIKLINDLMKTDKIKTLENLNKYLKSRCPMLPTPQLLKKQQILIIKEFTALFENLLIENTKSSLISEDGTNKKFKKVILHGRPICAKKTRVPPQPKSRSKQ